MKRKLLLAAASAAVLAGCDYTVPLAETPELPIDTALVGAWVRTTKEGAEEHLLVLPLSKNEDLVSFPARSKDAMFARACLCKSAGMALVQMTWFGTAQGVTLAEGRVYQYATFSVAGDTLKARLLNADVVDREAATPAALAAAIEANRKDPHLFRDVLEFKKVKPPDDPNAPPKRPPVPAAWQ